MSSDKYEELEKIGHGSFGVIRKVRRKVDGFILCRKEISYSRMSQKEREQLHAEFQILSSLRHQNIVAYYHREHLKASQDLHLYMEYCGNGDLGRTILDLKAKKQYASESFVWSIFTQTAMALYRCHYGLNPPEVGDNVFGKDPAPVRLPDQMTIMHRDLKPENVFLGENNSVKLGDFGLSKIVKTHDFASTYVGTPFYMSPEISAGERYTYKSDIWSLGCIMYELCSREPPFNGKSLSELVIQIRGGKVAPLHRSYSPELEGLIKECLKINPDRRPDTHEILNKPCMRLTRAQVAVVEDRNKLKIERAALKHERDAIDASLRREWEVKAHLEIDRHIKDERERLQKQLEDEKARLNKCYEDEKARVNVELQKVVASYAQREVKAPEIPEPGTKPNNQHSSVSGGSADEFSSLTDLTDYSIDSPNISREFKKPARTPFGRAQTMFAGAHADTPQDIEMLSPSPTAIASLSLSPRRTEAARAPTHKPGNIFAVNNSNNSKTLDSGVLSRWDSHREPVLEESDEEDVMVPSPTRQIKSSKNPFTAKDRPVLTTQKTAPVNRLRRSPTYTGVGFVSKLAVHSTPQLDMPPRSPSPHRRLSKIPSATNLNSDRENATALKRTQSLKQEPASQSTAKFSAKNVSNIKGRTLVELQQARAGGRPISGISQVDVSRPGSASDSDHAPPASPIRKRGNNGVAVWDPETDEMPSPFLIRSKRIVKV